MLSKSGIILAGEIILMSEAEEQMPKVARLFARYVFLDVVQFSHNRSAEAQSHIISELNRIVRETLSEFGVDNLTLLPTGDGMCIALHDLQFDLHIRVALKILERLEEYNQSTADVMRKFDVRIGINQNTDIVFDDINNRPNLAGAGINFASRIMDFAQGNQIFVSDVVFNELQPSEEYMNKFQRFTTTTKHSLPITAYQFIGEGYRGLSLDIPSQFKEKTLTRFAAYYLAHAIKLREAIIEAMNKDLHRSLTAIAIVVFLYFLTIDSIEASEATETQPYNPSQRLGFRKHIDYYCEVPVVDLCFAFCQILFFKEFSNYDDCFEWSGSLYAPVFITQKGIDKLKTERPEIYKEINPTFVTIG